MNETTFKDGKGNAWAFHVTIGVARRIKTETGFDLLELMNPTSEEFQRFTADHYLMFNVLAAALRPQLDARGMTDDDLAELFDNEQILQDATESFIRSVINFSQREKAELIGPAFSQVAQRTREAIRKQMDATREVMAGPEWDKVVDQAIENELKTAGPSTAGG